MLKEVEFAGIYFAPFVLNLLLAAPVFFVCRWLLGRCGVLSRIWYLALFELALFVVIVFLMLPFV